MTEKRSRASKDTGEGQARGEPGVCDEKKVSHRAGLRRQNLREMPSGTDNEPRITTACLLAAGTGSRLRPLTDSIPKCLTEINGSPILGRLVACLREQGFERLVVVVGYLEERIRKFLDDCSGDMVIEYVYNPLYRTTNNIYSLWLARSKIQEPFLLVESDLIFKASLLKDLLLPDKIAVSRVLPWMNGTTVTMDSWGHVASFSSIAPASHRGPGSQRGREYKTVNIYSLSRDTWSRVFQRLERMIADGRVNEYYEAVFSAMVADGTLSFECVVFGSDQWYEVDKFEDLQGAERIASQLARPTEPLLPPLIQPSGAPA